MNDDPRPNYFVGKTVYFDHEGVRRVGHVEAQRFIGYTKVGQLPDWTLVIRGRSGKVLTAALVESRASFPAT